MTLLVVWLGLALLGFSGAVPAHAQESDSARLRDMVRAHPDDPDLGFALAHALESEGDLEGAAALLAALAERLPARAGRGLAELGRVHYRAGRYEDAVLALERARSRGELDGAAELTLGLALRQLGRLAESERALARADGSSPDLAAEKAVLRALNQYELGAPDAGESLLRRAIELAPESETGRQARALLAGSAPWLGRERRINLTAWTGLEFDSNVALEGEGISSATDESDGRLLLGAALAGRPIDREGAGLTAGYRYNESAHRELQEFDLRSHGPFLSATYDASQGVQLRLDALADFAELDSERYLRSYTLRPNVFYRVGQRAGLTRLYGELVGEDYHDAPLLSSLERSGKHYALAAEHYLPLPKLRDTFAALGGRVGTLRTRGSRELGFASAFDHHNAEAELRLFFPLPFEVRGELQSQLGWSRYGHRNVVDFIVPDGSLDRRRDRTLSVGAALSRKLTRYLSVELRTSFLHQSSNVGPYAYDRHITGLYVRAATF